MRGSRRGPAGSRVEFLPNAPANGCVGLEGSPAGGLRHHSLPLHDAEIAPRNRGVPRAQASHFHPRCTAVSGSKLASGGACHDVDRHVHVQHLPDHRLHSCIWAECASLARTRQSCHYLGHGRSNFLWLPVMGAFSDRVGRRPLLFGCTILVLLTAYPALSWLIGFASFQRLLSVQLWLSFLYGSYKCT